MMLALFIAAALGYGAATYLYGSEPVSGLGTGAAAARGSAEASPGRGEREERSLQRLGRPVLALAALLHFLAIGAQCLQGDHPLKNIFLATSFGAWFAVTGYLPLSRGQKLDALGPIMAAIGLIGLVLGVVFSGMGEGQIPGVSGVASAHVFLASAGLAGFMLAAGVAGLYLVVERRLRNKVFRPGQRGMSLTGLDRLHYRIVLLVTPVFTLAIVTGVLWVLEVGDPGQFAGRAFEIAAAGIAWLASVFLLVARAAWGTRGRRSAWLTLLAFGAIILIVVSYGVRA